MKKSLIIAFILFIVPYLPKIALTQEIVQSTGMATITGNLIDIARDKALDNALRNAVEQKAGTMISGFTEVENFQVKMDQILAESKGFIKNYRIISEGREGSVYRVTVEAEVESGRLKDKLEAAQLITVRKDKPRLMFITHGKEKKDLHTEAVVTKFFIERGFTLKDYTSRGVDDYKAITANRNFATDFAKRHGAEVLVLLSSDDTSKTFKMGEIELTTHDVTVSYKIIYGDTGEIITAGSKNAKGDFITAIETASKNASKQIYEDIIERWSSELANVLKVQLVLSGLNDFSDIYKLKSELNEKVKGLKAIYQRNYSNGMLEMDLEIRGTLQGLADDLLQVQIGNKKIFITGVSSNRINAEMKLQ
ncbi:MAG: flagellar assembly protein T N-terminal domain-containing protein [Syntrophales bacterium]|nr:flagellar assembly protein T N-terminal domain-containing protein [Syntrophales bacterium]